MTVKVTDEQVAAATEQMHFVNGTRYKYPVKECGRCGGTGRYSYNQIDGDRCYGCSGTGVQFANKAVTQIVIDKRAEIKAARQPILQDLKVGDEIIAGLKSRKDHGDTWVTVLELEKLDEACGWKGDGSGEYVPTAWYHRIVTSDGVTREKTSGNQIVRRKANVDYGDAIAAADAAVVTLARKQAREALK